VINFHGRIAKGKTLPRFAANIDWMFCELPFLKRFEAAAQAGFRGVEFLFPYSHSVFEIAELLKIHELENVLFNLPAGDWANGQRGIACLPEMQLAFRDSVELAIQYAVPLRTRRLHALAGIVAPGRDPDELREMYVANLRYAARRVAPYGVILLVEAINSFDMPGYLVRTQAESQRICTDVDEPNVRMQLDLYHMQMSEGNLAAGLRRYYRNYDHVQLAGVPGRHEPDAGEINYPYLFGVLDELGYSGWVGCEYSPLQQTRDGLGWFGAAGNE
jgi:hydroxypyruvate isomerase